jgi:hypothetical protein
VKNKKIQGTFAGSSPKLAPGLWSRIVSHGPPIGHLLGMLLFQQCVHLRHLLLLLKLPLGRILHMSVKCILDFTYADFQSSKSGVDAIQPLTV